MGEKKKGNKKDQKRPKKAKKEKKRQPIRKSKLATNSTGLERRPERLGGCITTTR